MPVKIFIGLIFGMGETNLIQVSTFNLVIEDTRQNKNWDLSVSYTGEFMAVTMKLKYNLYFNEISLSSTPHP